MKRVSIILSVIIVLLVLVACQNNTPEENSFIDSPPGSGNDMQKGKYITADRLAWIILNDDYEFEFQRSVGTSYRPTGTYQIEDDILTLLAHDSDDYSEYFIFRINDGQLIFESGEPQGMAIVEEGTVFMCIQE